MGALRERVGHGREPASSQGSLAFPLCLWKWQCLCLVFRGTGPGRCLKGLQRSLARRGPWLQLHGVCCRGELQDDPWKQREGTMCPWKYRKLP